MNNETNNSKVRRFIEAKMKERFGHDMETMVSNIYTTSTYRDPVLTMEDIRHLGEKIRSLHVVPEINAGKIIESVAMTQDGPPHEIERSWRERLFTRPWRPFKKTRTVIMRVPRDDALVMDDGSLVMHPQTAAKVRLAIKTYEQKWPSHMMEPFGGRPHEKSHNPFGPVIDTSGA